MSWYNRLVDICVEGVSTYDSTKNGVDEHLETFLKDPKLNVSLASASYTSIQALRIIESVVFFNRQKFLNTHVILFLK